MKKTITAAQLAAIYEASKALEGTPQYSRYYMPYEYKSNGGKWRFAGYGVPQSYEIGEDKPIKTYRGNEYIMINAEMRFTIIEPVEELIKDI